MLVERETKRYEFEEEPHLVKHVYLFLDTILISFDTKWFKNEVTSLDEKEKSVLHSFEAFLIRQTVFPESCFKRLREDNTASDKQDHRFKTEKFSQNCGSCNDSAAYAKETEA